MELPQHPYAAFLHEVQKPVQYLGGEPGEKRRDWAAAKATLCLAFPDLYEIGMSHLGFKILYSLVNGREDLLAERAFAPWKDLEAKLVEHGETLRSLENGRPLSDFDVVGFSLQSELTYTNLLTMLTRGGIPRLAKDRTEADPLIIAGGPVATHAEPLVDFIDAFLIGDGEHKATELLDRWAEMRDAGWSRDDRLAEIARLGGWYVPSRYTRAQTDTGFEVVHAPIGDAPLPVKRHMVDDLKDWAYPTDTPTASTETVFDRVSVEIARGCTEGCRFCQAGMIYRPVRERDPQHVIDAITKSVDNAGYDEASLTSLSTADYSAIQPLVKKTLEALEGKNVSLSVSSLRAYGLSEEVLDDMSTQRAGGLTFAPEAGTQRMRDVVNKNVTEEQLMETARRVFTRGWTKMKLYFMVGLPTEEDDDVRGIVQTGARALGVAREVRGKAGARVTVAVSNHVPKPHTPFQWCATDSVQEVRRKQRILREEGLKTRINLRMHDPKSTWLEAILARGDHRLGAAIAWAWDHGARFDSWDEQLDLDVWLKAFEACGVDIAPTLSTVPLDARVPWDHLDVGLEEGFLAREYKRALKDRLSPPCGKPKGAFVHHSNLEEHEADTRKLVCYHCGVACDMTAMREERTEFLVQLGAKTPPPPSPLRALPEAEIQLARKKRVDRRPMLEIDQGTPLRVRLRFTKLGRIAFSGHLDLVRMLPRAFRRAGVPLFLSEGYNPIPRMMFGPALSLGTSALSEYLDVQLRKEEAGEELLGDLLDRMRPYELEGVRMTAVEFLGAKDKPISKVLGRASYVAGLSLAGLEAIGLGTEAEVAARIEARRAGPLTMRKVKRGIGREIDLKAQLVDVAVGEGAEVLAQAGLTGALLPVRIEMSIENSATPNPMKVLAAMLDTAEPPARMVRRGLYALRDGVLVSPMDLEALREAPTPAGPPEASAP